MHSLAEVELCQVKICNIHAQVIVSPCICPYLGLAVTPNLSLAPTPKGKHDVTAQPTRGYEFAGYRFAPNLRLLWRDGETLALTDRLSRMLTYLIEQRGRTVSQSELLEALWHDTHVAEANVRVTMNRLRAVLRADEINAPLILTIPKQGYRFVADVVVRLQENPPTALLNLQRPCSRSKRWGSANFSHLITSPKSM